nr:Gfo/Idh/MocA family oxidoreductase [bacterium]
MRWGIIGTGSIVRRISKSFEAVDGPTIYAIASHSQERAQWAANTYGAKRGYGSWEELVCDPDVEVVYVATPHHEHLPATLLALEHGKPVLCEKPFAMNAAQAQEMIACAKKRGLFLMEAMWTRFLPVMQQVKTWIAEGKIGQVRQVMADFGYRSPIDSASRIFNAAMGGGAMLDVGVYPVSLAMWLLDGVPSQIKTVSDIGQTGVDEQCGVLLGYPDGAFAMCSGAIRTDTVQQAMIYGTHGYISIPSFWNASEATLVTADGGRQSVSAHMKAEGFEYELLAVEACLSAGKTQSEIMPWEDTLRVMRVLDIIRGL